MRASNRSQKAGLDAHGDRSPDAFIELSRVQRRQGNLESAEEIALEASAMYPDHMRLAIERASIAMAGRNWATAIRRYEAVLDTYGDRCPAHVFVKLSRALRKQGEFDKARDVAERGTAVHSDDLKLTTELVEVAIARRDWSEAVRLCLPRLDGPESTETHTIDDRIATVCVGLLDDNEYDRVTEIIETMKLRCGRRRSFLAVEGIALLRASRREEARVHWSDYWKTALGDDGFANEADLRMPPGNVANHGYRVISRGDDFQYGVIGPRFCVYTALFGEYDSLPTPLFAPPGIDFICFSDRPRDTSGWDVRIVDPGMNHPSLQCRKLKILPYEYLSAYEYSLYVDANILFFGDPLLLYHHWLHGRPFVAWRHPYRSDVYRECEVILALLKHEPEPILAQYEHFRNEEVPHDTGMIEAAMLWRSHRDPQVRELMERWWAHVDRFGGRDQPGFAYWAWKSDIQPEVMPEHLGTARKNEFFAGRPHDLTMIQVEQARSTSTGPPDFNGAPHGNPREKTPQPRQRRCPQRLTWIYRQESRSVASTVMRGHQLSEIAKLHLDGDVEVSYVDESGIDGLSESILILTKGFLKDATREELNALKDARNIVCVDFVDDPVRPELDECIDVYVVASIRQFLDFSQTRPHKLVHLISHHADPLIVGRMGPEGYCNIGYFGEIANALYRRQLQGVIDFCHVDTQAESAHWMQRLRQSNVHYAVRKWQSFDGYKPFLKGFTAARCHANIIVPLDEGDARYYLGSDYPYILKDDSLSSILEMIDYVKDSFGGPDWNRGLEIMTSVRERCSPLQIAGEVRALAGRLG